MTLGATPGWLARLICIEIGWLGILSGIAGTGIGVVLGPVLVPLLRLGWEPILGSAWPWRTLILSAVIGLGTGLLAASIPAWISYRLPPAAVLAGVATTVRSGVVRFQRALLFLLATLAGVSLPAALLWTGVAAYESSHPFGIERAAELLILTLSATDTEQGTPTATYDDAVRIHRTLREAPGFPVPVLASSTPATGWERRDPIRLVQERSQEAYLSITAAEPLVFLQWGMLPICGRVLSDVDRPASPLVVVLNRHGADALGPGKMACELVGHQIALPPGGKEGVSFARVVGVVEDDESLLNPRTESVSPPRAYISRHQFPLDRPSWYIMWRSVGPQNLTAASAGLFSRDVHGGDRFPKVRSFAEETAGTARGITQQAILLWLLALSVVSVLGAGLYGAIAYYLHQQRAGLALRIALGAPLSHTTWLVMRRALAVLGGSLAMAGGIWGVLVQGGVDIPGASDSGRVVVAFLTGSGVISAVMAAAHVPTLRALRQLSLPELMRDS